MTAEELKKRIASDLDMLYNMGKIAGLDSAAEIMKGQDESKTK